MRRNLHLSLDDVWRRGLIDRLERLETLSDRVAAAGRAPRAPQPGGSAGRTEPAVCAPPSRVPVQMPLPAASRREEPLAIDELQRSLALALSVPAAAPVDLDAALAALTGEIGRIGETAREALPSGAEPSGPVPPPIPAALLRRAPVAFDDGAIVLPQALRPKRTSSPSPAQPLPGRRASVAGVALAAVVAAGALAYGAWPASDAGTIAGSATASKAEPRLPGRFEAQFGALDPDRRSREPLAPAAPRLVQVLPSATEVAAAAEAPEQDATAGGLAAPVQVMSMTPVEPAKAPLPPIPKVPGTGSAVPSVVASPTAPAKRPHRVAVRKAPAEPESKAPPPRPVTATAVAATLRPVPRGPRPSGALTLGGPPPTSIGEASVEYRVNIPSAPPSWLPKPDQ